MSDTFITIMIILTAAVLIFMVPVIAVAKRHDVRATQTVQAAVTEFVDKTRTTGIITREDYDNLLQKMESTGNVYELEVSVQQIDENPAKKSTSNVTDELKIGENVYYIEYTTQIEEAFKKSTDSKIRLSAGDYIKVDAKNKNQTLYQSFKKTLYNLSSGKVGTISGIHVGIVIEPAEGEQIGTIAGAGIQYAIRYDANGGIQTTCPYSATGYIQYKNRGENITLSDIRPMHTNTNLRFVGWSEDRYATEATYPSGGVFTKDSNTTLYAVWKNATYNIAYSSNLAIQANGLPAQDVGLQLGQSYTIWNGRGTPTARGYIFKKWNTSPDGTGTTYNSGDTITINGSRMLYAIWEAESFTLTFNKNAGGSVVSDMPGNMSCRYWEQFTLPSSIPTRNNYKFLGWSTESDGEVEFKAGESCAIQPYNTTLYAIWGEKHDLKYNSNIRVLIVGYKNASWVNSAVNYFTNQRSI